MRGAKKKAWEWFSKYIRLRDCIETTGTPDYCICCSCKHLTPDRDGELHAGHAIGGRNNTVLLNEELVHGQCRTCNSPRGKAGNYAPYSLYMIDKYGLERWKELEFISRKGQTIKEFQWKEFSEYYKKKYQDLLTVGKEMT